MPNSLASFLVAGPECVLLFLGCLNSTTFECVEYLDIMFAASSTADGSSSFSSICSIDFKSSDFVSSFGSGRASSGWISKNGIPILTLSPTFKRTLFTVPLIDDGISIAALSVSKTNIGSSELTF